MIHPVLAEQGQFLHLSRTQPELFSIASEFMLEDHTRVIISAPGIIRFEPVEPQGNNIVLSCGIHGNETAPIEILDQMVQDILCQRLKVVHRLMVQFGNLAAMDIAERFVTENMNRLFSGAHSQGPGLINAERHRAKALEDAVADFFEANQGPRYHFDLHTAIRASKNDKFAVYPFQHGKPWKASQLQFMLACGVNTILLSNGPTTTYSYFSSNSFGADAFTVELGKVKPFGQNNPEDFVDVTRTLRDWVSQSTLELPDLTPKAITLYRVNQVINRQEHEFKLHFDDDTPNFTDFRAGDLLASEPNKQYCAQQDGEAIVFPNAKVAIGQRALLTVVPISLEEANRNCD